MEGVLRKLFTVAVLSALALSACRRTDIRTVRVYVPDMRTASDAEKVVAAVSNVPGVLCATVSADTDNGVVTVSYESLLLAKKNIESAIAGGGYRVVEVVSRGQRGMLTNEVPAAVHAESPPAAEGGPSAGSNSVTDAGPSAGG